MRFLGAACQEVCCTLLLQARVIQGLAAFAASDLPTAGKVGDAALQQLLDAAGSPEVQIQVTDLLPVFGGP